MTFQGVGEKEAHQIPPQMLIGCCLASLALHPGLWLGRCDLKQRGLLNVWVSEYPHTHYHVTMRIVHVMRSMFRVGRWGVFVLNPVCVPP